MTEWSVFIVHFLSFPVCIVAYLFYFAISFHSYIVKRNSCKKQPFSIFPNNPLFNYSDFLEEEHEVTHTYYLYSMSVGCNIIETNVRIKGKQGREGEKVVHCRVDSFTGKLQLVTRVMYLLGEKRRKAFIWLLSVSHPLLVKIHPKWH